MLLKNLLLAPNLELQHRFRGMNIPCAKFKGILTLDYFPPSEHQDSEDEVI